MFDLTGNHYPSQVLLEHVNIRRLKSQPQQKRTQRSAPQSMQITLSEAAALLAVALAAARCEGDFVFYLQKFVEQEGKPVRQHLLRHRLCSAKQKERALIY